MFPFFFWGAVSVGIGGWKGGLWRKKRGKLFLPPQCCLIYLLLISHIDNIWLDSFPLEQKNFSSSALIAVIFFIPRVLTQRRNRCGN